MKTIADFIDKWFEGHSTLTKDNYDVLKECYSFFRVEPEEKIGPDEKIEPGEKIEKPKSKPKGALTSKKYYNRYIYKDECDKVKQAVAFVSIGYKATVKHIMDQTGLKKQKVMGILQYLIEENIVKRKYGDKGIVIYQLKG